MENLVVSLIVPVWCGWIAGNNFYFIAESSSGK